MLDLPPMSSRTSKLAALLRYTNSPRQSPSGVGNTRYSPRLITLAKSASSLTPARPRVSFAVPKSSNQCSGLSMQWSTRALPSGNRTTAFFTAADNVPVTDVAREQAGEGRRVGALAEDADVVGK